MIDGDISFNVNFALSEPLPSMAVVLISTFTKFDEYCICIAVITMEYEIPNSVHQVN